MLAENEKHDSISCMEPIQASHIVVSDFCREGFFRNNPNISERTVLNRVHDAIDARQIRLPTEHRRDGHVWLVAINPDGFTSRVKKLQAGDYLLGRYRPRTEGEAPRKSVNVLVNDLSAGVPAVSVDVVLYSEDALCEDPMHIREEGVDFEIVAILAKSCEGDEPMDTDTLLHNHFMSSGGTATGMNDAEFVAALKRSFEYWKQHARIH